MVSFYVYDIIFFLLFTLGVIFFLVKNRKKKGFKREGWLFMYRTQHGVDAMSWFDKKFHKTLGWLRYVIIGLGYVLMILMIWMLLQSVFQYATQPEITDTIKAPPIAPLIPYFPEIFGMQSFFPPFYFTYFLIALAIVALVHEFSHGIFMKYSKTKIKSTGFLFMGPVLGAFVEEDKNSLISKSRKDQMAVLGAGVFANVLTAIVFYLIYSLIFMGAFTPAGYTFDNYAFSYLDTTKIDSIINLSENQIEIKAGNQSYFLEDEKMIAQLNSNASYISAYDSAPAYLSKIKGNILSIDGKDTLSYEQFKEVLNGYSSGENVIIKTDDSENNIYNITFAENPTNKSLAYLGVINYDYSSKGFRSFVSKLMGMQDGPTNYVPKHNPGLTYFFYNMVWWIMIINFLVALFNMLPLGILDGGRFFYLTIEKFTGPKKAEKAYKFASIFIAAIFIALLGIWLFRILF